MKDNNLNVVYIGPPSFPLGWASTKRRRYMVDYMNDHEISCHVLVTGLFRNKQNPIQGKYRNTDYYDLSSFLVRKNVFGYLKKGINLLAQWYVPNKKNILIFHTLLYWNEWLFYKFAKRKGYVIVFDQVETSYLQNKTGSFAFRCITRLSELISDKAYQSCPAFVISSALMMENTQKYPKRKLCLLQNSTPIADVPLKQYVNKPIVLLYSGTYTPKDGVSFLIDGVIQAHNNVDCKLVLLGKGNKQDMKVLNKIVGKDYIEYKGFVSDETLNSIMLQSDILCMTRTNSRFANYGFPFKLSEYLATGNILLATDVGDVAKYVQDKKSALIVQPESATAISNAIKYVDVNRDESINIANNGYNVAKEHFSIEHVGNIFVSFLKEL